MVHRPLSVGEQMQILLVRSGMPVEFLPGAKNVAPIALSGPY